MNGRGLMGSLLAAEMLEGAGLSTDKSTLVDHTGQKLS